MLADDSVAASHMAAPLLFLFLHGVLREKKSREKFSQCVKLRVQLVPSSVSSNVKLNAEFNIGKNF